MKSDIEQSYIADIISSRYPTSEPEGIVEIGELTREPAQFSATATKQDGGVGFVQGAAPAPMSSSSIAPTTGRVFPEDTASIQSIPRTQLEEMIGNIGAAIQTGADAIDFAVIGLPDVGTLSLKDLTVGDLGKVMEAMSYGFTPTTGEGQTLRPTPEALDLLNAIPAFQAAGKVIKYGAKQLAPAAANMMEEGLRKTGMIMDIVPDGKSVAQQAPKSDIGFYSAVENAAVNVQRKSGTGQSFLNDIMKGENVKAEEIKWIGLDDFLKDKKNVTKQEVQNYIANNKVDVKEVALGAKQSPFIEPEKAIEYIAKEYNMTPSEVKSHWAYADENDYVDLANQSIPKSTARFESYTLAGGENYREILLTMPNTKAAKLDARRAELEAKGSNITDADRAEWASIMNKLQPETRDIEGVSRFRGMPDYKSAHFPDQSNILAHLRVNDRVDADGKKMLLIEEVQSDWHQAGRNRGYGLSPSRFILRNPKTGGQVGDFATKAEAEEFMKTSFRSEEFSKGGFFVDEIKGKVDVPDAPFKDTWYQLALKRALQYAAENGYERVGLTTGKQQAARYDLSKQVDVLYPSKEMDGTYSIDATRKNDGEVINIVKNIKESELSNYVGKDIANKIVKEKLDLGEDFEIAGLDLSIGGEGMKKYYDEIYPKFLEKYGKKWNAKIGDTKVNTVMERAENSMIPKMGQEPVRYIDITPEMKAGVQKGQPLFAAAPIGAATGAATMQDERKK
jgi:hypothetical protein